MTPEEKKKYLQYLLENSDEELTNILMEAAETYRRKVVENWEPDEEFIVEMEQRSADLRSGKDKGSNPEETIEFTRKFLKEKFNVDYNPNIS